MRFQVENEIFGAKNLEILDFPRVILIWFYGDVETLRGRGMTPGAAPSILEPIKNTLGKYIF